MNKRWTTRLMGLAMALGAAALPAARAAAQSAQPPLPQAVDLSARVPDELRDVGVDQGKLGAFVPFSAAFTNDRGEYVTLDTYFHHGRPVVLQLGYYECPGICDSISHALVDGAKAAKLKIGTDYDVLFVSIDPSESPSLAAMKRHSVIEYYGKPEEAGGFFFTVGTRSQIKQLTDAVGYHFKPMKDGQFAHPATLIVLTPEGKISQYLDGGNLDPQSLRLSVVIASGNKVGDLWDHIFATCLHYDATTGKYTGMAFLLLRLAGGLTIVILGGIVLRSLLREHRAKARAAHNDDSTDLSPHPRP